MSSSDEEVVVDDVAAEEELTLSDADVATKYNSAAQIAKKAMGMVCAKVVAGAAVVDVCTFGDKLITALASRLFKKKKDMKKGVAFPTCVSVNEMVCHVSPFASEGAILAAGDLVRIDLGVHVDGYVAVVAHTVEVAAAAEEGAAAAPPAVPIAGKRADVIQAAQTALTVAHKLMRPGATNEQITAAIKQVAEDYGVNCVQGVLSHQMKRFVIDGSNVIIQREETDQKVAAFEIQPYEVYAIDISMSTGEGKLKEGEQRTTVFKRATDVQYRLKSKTARAVLKSVNANHSSLPFTLQCPSFEERTSRLGVIECVKHGLLQPYPVLYEKVGEDVAHFKATVLVLASGTSMVTSGPALQALTTDKVDSDATKAILALSSKKKKKKKKKKKPAAGDAATK
jgi:curved DNA binding protein